MSRDFADLIAVLNDQGVRYLLVGAFAVAFHSRPRFTKDLDIWVEPVAENAQKVRLALLSFGAPVRHVQEVNLTRKGEALQIGVAPARIDILTEVEPLIFAECWERRSEGVFLDQPTHYLGLEDLLACKRHANRPKDRLDVQMLEKARQAKGSVARNSKQKRKERKK